MKTLSTALLALSLPLIASSDDTIPRARLYAHNCDVQRDWTASLLHDLTIGQRATILHYGCRDAESSVELLSRVPEGWVIALEESPQFRHWSHRKYPNLEFPKLALDSTLSYLAQDESSAAFRDNPLPIADVVICIDQIWREHDPQQTLQQLFHMLRQHGTLYLSVLQPELDPKFERLVRRVYEQQGVAYPFDDEGIARVCNCPNLWWNLESVGFDTPRIETVRRNVPFADQEDLQRWLTAWIATDSSVCLEGLRAAVDASVAEFLSEDPYAQQANGSIWLPMSHLEVVAVRSAPYKQWND